MNFVDLLENYLILKERDKDLYYDVKDNIDKYKSFIYDNLAYDIIIKDDFIKLEKIPGIPEEWMGINEFTTSMVISPHKNYEKLTKIGNSIADKYSIEYLSTNFRKQDGFLKTNQISKSLNLYRQNYCGCKFAQRA